MPVEQTDLTGESIGEPERIECEMYPICSADAQFEVETLVYEGGGYVYDDLVACRSCTREVTEPTEPEDADEARELEFAERLAESNSNPEGSE